ncbi:uncharacterized protein LTR77_008140 [Saxophila tyrrhenica]|uniref:Chromatin assembly factor 1 subunit A n=1 Tax=Saxophila tyrrhenica TaxID=1690608 RepID=A0AAV9P2R0_9PEZI|nr:hypothetical protein LTR77_008140 [Saxophila tyrrhenica]
MEDIKSATSSPNPRKRAAPDDESIEKRPLNLTGSQFLPTPPDTDGSSDTSPTCTNEMTARQGSPAPSSSALSSVEVTGSNTDQGTPGAANVPQSSSAPPAKRRKLSPAEKEQQKQEKEAKDAERAAQKARREEEQRVKDEERRKKAEDRDAKKREKEVADERRAQEKRAKEEEKRVKDEEKRKKAEERDAKRREKEAEEERKAQEKLKKERAQMRLGAFFQKPATPIKQSEDGEGQPTTARRKSLSLEPFDAMADILRQSQSPCKETPQPQAKGPTPAKPVLSDYHKHFLPFELKAHCSMVAPRVPDDPDAAQEAFDRELSDQSIQMKYNLGLVDSYVSLENFFATESPYTRGAPLPSTRKLVDQIQGTLQQPVDLTSDETPANPMAALQETQRRYLEFDEDVRPPYFGTYSKIRSPRTMAKLCRAPLTRARPDTNYDYDSEAEWEEPDEADEECHDDDEDEAESQGDANELDEFLDDEDDAPKNKRKMITGDLVPASTGLCWEDPAGKIVPSIESELSTAFMNDMRIGVLLPDFHGSTIDPFSMKYWSGPAPAPLPALKVAPSPSQAFDAMMRPPLQPRSNTNANLDNVLVGAAEGMRGPITSAAGTQCGTPKPKAAPKVLSKEDLDEFKDAVVGSQLTKADMLKGLKARFPKTTIETIRATLGEHFAQVGANRADKKWVFISAA